MRGKMGENGAENGAKGAKKRDKGPKRVKKGHERVKRGVKSKRTKIQFCSFLKGGGLRESYNGILPI